MIGLRHCARDNSRGKCDSEDPSLARIPTISRGSKIRSHWKGGGDRE